MTGSRIGGEAADLWPDQLRGLVGRILEARDNGLLDGNAAAELARLLVVGDGAGRLWTVGLETGRFYRWRRDGWVADEPTGRLLVLAPEKPAAMSGAGATAPGSTCPACGAPARNRESRFCDRCGTPLRSPPGPAPCAACGAPLRPGVRFCTRCGAAVR